MGVEPDEEPTTVDDPTVEADQADPGEPGPGDSEGSRPEPEPDDSEGSRQEPQRE